MVTNEMMVHGVDMIGAEQKLPVILQMHDDDFPARFLKDLASPNATPISSTSVVDTSSQPLYQPVQRMVTIAMVDLSCTGLGNPAIDPRRIESAGLVVRRVFRAPKSGGGATEEYNTLSGWMRNPSGQSNWVKLTPAQETWDPDPTKRPQLQSGNPDLDAQLTALYLSTANTESTTPAYAAPPATCAALGRTVFYAMIPTASSEVSDAAPKQPPLIDKSGLISSLPAILRFQPGDSTPWSPTPTPPPTVDYRWMSDEFLNIVYPPTLSTASPPTAPTPNPQVAQFQQFTTALRMLHTVFGAFDSPVGNNPILDLLNGRNVTFADNSTARMGDYFLQAKQTLLDYSPYPTASPNAPTIQMPATWDSLTDKDQEALVNAMMGMIGPRSQSLNLLSPQGRFMDETRYYKLRMFFRVKSNSGNCPPKLFWSQYSEPFQIAPWYAGGSRPHPPVPLPDPTSAFVQSAKPNCSFQVPGNLMSAMQGTSMSGLMNGSGGGGGLSLGWICGFNIPLITICAFFVLNIFLSLLNIIFFWLPFIKICIPFPMPSPSTPDEGTP